MSVDETANAHQELAELRKLIRECRTDLGIPEPKAAGRPRLVRLRGSRRAGRQAPVA